MKDNNFYTAEELAKELRVNIMTIYRYIKAGKIKAHKIGKEFRIDKKEFYNFLDNVRTELKKISKTRDKVSKSLVINIKKEHSQIENKINKSLDLLLNGVITKDVFSKKLKEYQEEKAELEYKLRDYEVK